MFVNIDFSCV